MQGGGGYHKRDPAPFSLYNRSTTASRYISDHKKHGQKKPGKHGGYGQPMCDPRGVQPFWGLSPPPPLTQTLGVGRSGGQPPGSQGEGGGGGYPNIHTSK